MSTSPTTDAGEDVIVAQHPKYRGARLVYTKAGARLGMISTRTPGTFLAFRRQGEPDDHRKVADFTSIDSAARWIARGNF